MRAVCAQFPTFSGSFAAKLSRGLPKGTTTWNSGLRGEEQRWSCDETVEIGTFRAKTIEYVVYLGEVLSHLAPKMFS